MTSRWTNEAAGGGRRSHIPAASHRDTLHDVLHHAQHDCPSRSAPLPLCPSRDAPRPRPRPPRTAMTSSMVHCRCIAPSMSGSDSRVPSGSATSGPLLVCARCMSDTYRCCHRTRCGRSSGSSGSGRTPLDTAAMASAAAAAAGPDARCRAMPRDTPVVVTSRCSKWGSSSAPRPCGSTAHASCTFSVGEVWAGGRFLWVGYVRLG
eukprot:357218-Chlamydomonas_euryale.AAC.1